MPGSSNMNGNMPMGMMQGNGRGGGKHLQQYNNRYKTQLCKHWQQIGNCHVGARCHFAHGEPELRKVDDALPFEVQMKMMNIPYNNYKTVRCKFFDSEG